jgi:DNA-cytosine methyltransferase
MSKIKVLSLFDGISCAQVALKALGYEPEYYASEIDKYAITITQLRHPETKQLGSVTDIKGAEFTGIDLLIGGSPCQDLSVAKVGRLGLAGERSKLFFEYVRLLKEVNPKYFVLENVASMSKENKNKITEIMGVEPILINAALVSAQSRKRLFWTNIPGIEQPTDRGILLKDIIEKGFVVDDKARTITASYSKGANIKNIGTHRERQLVWLAPIQVGQVAKGMSGRVYSINGKSVALKAGGGGSGAKTGLYDFSEAHAGRIVGRKLDENGTRKDYSDIKAVQMLEINENPSKTNTLSTVAKDNVIAWRQFVRPLTPVECERLQSLPDEYTEGVSNAQRYKALGNAFNAEVVRHILSYMKL